MQIASYYSNADIRIHDIPIPEIGDGECLIKVHSSGICGSDLMEWYRKEKVPLVLGHEIAGEIIAVGKGVHHIQEGDRVAASHHVPCMECKYCQRGKETVCSTLRSTTFDPGGFSQYVRMPEINTRFGVFPIPDNVTYDEASFAEPLSCVIRGQNRINLKENDSVIVIGSGISGILHIALARSKGAKYIAAIDINPERLKWAEKFGADITAATVEDVETHLLEKTGSKADKVILTTGNPNAILSGIEAVDDGGEVLLFAPTEPGINIPISVNDVFFKHEKTLTTTYANSPEELKEALKIISCHEVDVAGMITHKLGIEDIQMGFALVRSGEDSLKVIINPNQNGQVETNAN
ncbi:MAG: alcohol dehydrogenase catalytic domain-containing protein [Candidatus Marinimicrobia bacterium]|jgi:L-iditol 2-dehydrogenase|nr:alcohol dehydrogenase catalytic domain-containing protein [Candidatus Neomarinimicrobiota bacterium]